MRGLICLDYDGVIVDSVERQLVIGRQAQERIGQGRPPTREDLATVANLTYEDVAALLGLPVDLWRDTVHALLVEEGDDSDFFPNMPGILKALSESYQLVIITSNVSDVVRKKLARFGIADCVSRIFDSRMEGSKADKIRAACRELGIAQSHTFMVGDSRGDIRAGKTANVRSIAVAWGYQSVETLRIERPEAILEVPEDLLRFFSLLVNKEIQG